MTTIEATSRRDEPLRFELRNRRPVAVADFTASLTAFDGQYRRYLGETEGDAAAESTALYITRIRSGSILADLSSYSEQISFVVEHRELIAGFVTHLNELFQFFLTGKGHKPTLHDNDLRQVSQIIEPVAKENGSQLNLSINSNGGPVNVTINSIDANAIQNGIARALNRMPQLEDRTFRKEPLYLYQARDDTRSTTGDKGIIEKFSERPLKLVFENEDAKKMVLDQEGNIFRLVFIVDGEVSLVDGKPAVFKITRVHEVIEKPE
jgi:hypothetical protein